MVVYSLSGRAGRTPRTERKWTLFLVPVGVRSRQLQGSLRHITYDRKVPCASNVTLHLCSGILFHVALILKRLSLPVNYKTRATFVP